MFCLLNLDNRGSCKKDVKVSTLKDPINPNPPPPFTLLTGEGFQNVRIFWWRVQRTRRGKNRVGRITIEKERGEEVERDPGRRKGRTEEKRRWKVRDNGE